MKIITMKKPKEKRKKDMFAVLCLLQFALVAVIILMFRVFVEINSDAFAQITDDLSYIFEKDIDIGGYYVPSEDQTTRKYADPISFSAYAKEEPSESEKTDALTKNEAFDIYSASVAVIPVNGTVTSEYGYREHPVYSGDSFHSGRDIAADQGTDIHAVLDGTVTEAGTAEMAGNYIKIDHHNGYETLYCHCSELYVSAGMNIRKGDVIAAVGQTGLATGPHLHFELHENGAATDPEKLLGDACDVY